MPTNHPVVAAIPDAGAPNKELLRDLIARSLPLVVISAAEAQDLVTTDPDYGVTTLALILHGRIFVFDPDDTTTAHDGIACLVSSDGNRYKVEQTAFPYAALDKDLTEPPEEPSIGDVYLIHGAPLGDWAEHQGDIAIFTSRGWEFLEAPIGRFLYLEDEDAYYHVDDGGDWATGLGALLYAAGTVPPSAVIGGGGRVAWQVEDQSTNDPPGTVIEGAAYIIGSSPTGDWSGHAGKIAHGENGAWVIYTPAEGWQAYDKAIDRLLLHTGSAWISRTGAWTSYSRTNRAATTATTAVTNASVAHTYNPDAGAPDYSNRRCRTDPATLSIAAPAGAQLRFRYRAFLGLNQGSESGMSGGTQMVLGLRRDNVAAMIDFVAIGNFSTGSDRVARNCDVTFYATAPDSDSHTYRVMFFDTFWDTNQHGYVANVNQMVFTVEVGA